VELAQGLAQHGHERGEDGGLLGVGRIWRGSRQRRESIRMRVSPEPAHDLAKSLGTDLLAQPEPDLREEAERRCATEPLHVELPIDEALDRERHGFSHRIIALAKAERGERVAIGKGRKRLVEQEAYLVTVLGDQAAAPLLAPVIDAPVGIGA
jgi:hypothetical protein